MSFINFKTQLFFAVLFFTLFSQVFGHSYVTSPASRSNQAQTLTGCRGPSCLGPCDAPLSSLSGRRTQIAQRGDAITIKWPRNNHAGGFIRFAWAPTSLSDSHAAFDAHVQQINCHEVGGCHPDDASAPNGGDTGPADGSSRACTSNFTIPLDLANGDWTLQWSWFGGAFNLGDYYSCVDYKIAGGPVGIMTPVFIGGDFGNPNSNKCKFFNTDKLHVCVNEPCYNGAYASSVQQSGVPGYNFSILNQIPTPSSPVTSAAAQPSTTAAPRPATTAAVRPSTTAAIRPATTGKPIAATTAAPMPSTTGSTEPISTPDKPTVPISNPMPCFTETGCILGDQFCVGSNQYQTCTNGREGTYYAAPQSCQAGLSCHASSTDNKIYCY